MSGKNSRLIELFTKNPLDKRIQYRLSVLYPNKRVEKLSKKDQQLYQLILKACSAHNMGIKKYLGNLEYAYIQQYEFGNRV